VFVSLTFVNFVFVSLRDEQWTLPAPSCYEGRGFSEVEEYGCRGCSLSTPIWAQCRPFWARFGRTLAQFGLNTEGADSGPTWASFGPNLGWANHT
jgi:hypothetical protein